MNNEENPESENSPQMQKIAVILFALGLVLVALHYLFLQEQDVHNDESWLITLDTTHVVKRENTLISIQPPYESQNLRLTGRRVAHIGLHLVPPKRSTISKRAILLRASTSGTYHTEMEFSVQYSRTPHFHVTSTRSLSTKLRQYFLADSDWLQLEDPKLEELLPKLGLNESDQEELVEKIFQFVMNLKNNKPVTFRFVSEILETRKANRHERALLMVALCRKAGIPARIVTGLELKEDPSTTADYWVEVNLNDSWQSFHPSLGYRNSLPDTFIALDKYGAGIVSGSLPDEPLGEHDYNFINDIIVERIPFTVRSPDTNQSEWYHVLIMDRLPSDTRDQLALLMLLPLGALLCSLIRQVGGLHSYGVFTPTVLALAMTYAEKETTFLIFIITVSLVYFGRPTFRHDMSRTPRLSIIFTLVATSMVVGVSVLDYFSLASDAHLILLPIVIITSLIDRFFSTVEKLGYHTAFIRLVWTVILTIAVLPILQLVWLGEWILRYPESQLFTLSLLILVSSYPFGKYKIPLPFNFMKEPEQKKVRKIIKKKKNDIVDPAD